MVDLNKMFRTVKTPRGGDPTYTQQSYDSINSLAAGVPVPPTKTFRKKQEASPVPNPLFKTKQLFRNTRKEIIYLFGQGIHVLILKDYDARVIKRSISYESREEMMLYWRAGSVKYIIEQPLPSG